MDIKELINKELVDLQETKRFDTAVKNAELNGFYSGAERALKVILNKIVEAENTELEAVKNKQVDNKVETKQGEVKKNSK